MNIVICPDKFKGSLNAKEVCNAVSAGLRAVYPDARIESVPLADGGEGTCALLTEWHQGHNIDIEVHGPLFTPVKARYGISKEGDKAFIEMAQASGLTLIEPKERNALLTTTLGTGEMIADAIRRKVKTVVLGIGGSATNDAGIGMATALGYKFYDADGKILKPTGENLIRINQINTNEVNPGLSHIRVVALCDVTNPLYGPEGAAFVYGPQKGASQGAVELLDAGLRNFEQVARKSLSKSINFPGSGAAGGLGAGASVFLNAAMERGIVHIIETTALAEKIIHSDLVITGEGKIDKQTFSGKVVSEVLGIAKKAGKPVFVICGICDVSEEEIKSRGIEKLISLVNDGTSLESAIQHAFSHITRRIKDEFKRMPRY